MSPLVIERCVTGVSLVSNKVGPWETLCTELACGHVWHGYIGMVKIGYNVQPSDYTQHNESHCWRRYIYSIRSKKLGRTCGSILTLGTLV